MKHFPKKTAVIVVLRNGIYYIIDGGQRYYSAIEAGNYESLDCIVLNIPDSEILDTRITYNLKTKVHTSEICMNIEHMLNLMGNDQGKRNDILGMHNIDDDNEFGTAGKDKFEIACMQSGLEFSGRTLRKLMAVHEFEKGEEKLKLIEGIDSGKLSIDKAHKLMKSYLEKSKSDSALNVPLPTLYENELNQVSYRLFNKSSMVMDEIEDESMDMFCDSHPYRKLRKYRNQIGLKHGEEKTLDEYVTNFKLFCREKKKKLKPGGVLVTILGETYRGGYNGVCTAVETALKEDGWEIIDVVIWVKLNQKYTPHPNRFVNSYERIIVLKKKGADPYFKEIKRKSSTGDFKVMPTSGGGFYVASPDTCIPNVITTSVHNPVEFGEIDKEFRHQAPAPEQIYKTFIEAYSKPNDTI
ncbi:MAG: DNA methyltransferase, partial [Crocinitomicaceae bacterium]|nr:DNA methyltransferase [Crocinitomicaceae bacterium]